MGAGKRFFRPVFVDPNVVPGTKVTTNGGHHSGVDYDFDNITTEGTLFSEYSKADTAELTER